MMRMEEARRTMSPEERGCCTSTARASAFCSAEFTTPSRSPACTPPSNMFWIVDIVYSYQHAACANRQLILPCVPWPGSVDT